MEINKNIEISIDVIDAIQQDIRLVSDFIFYRFDLWINATLGEYWIGDDLICLA